jgi:hypothetical protein
LGIAENPLYANFDPDFAAASDWARLYRAAGLQVVPCKDKRPVLKAWKEYQNELVPDAQFEVWYGPQGQYHAWNDMGLLTGKASGRVLMIDLDIYKAGGEAAAFWWQGVLATHNNGVDLETCKQITGGGGLQMFFIYPESWKFSVNAKTALNVDIRCQGGFAVLPPTIHESGKPYQWAIGCAPWEIDIAMAPDWLLVEVERLIREHGGGSHAGTNGAQHTESAAQYDAFGHQTDGRETLMRDLVWAAVIDWRRECPIKPSDGESYVKAVQKYRVYEAQVSARGNYTADITKSDALEMEGRGQTEFWSKWRYAMALWDGKVAEEARKPGKDKVQNKTEYSGPDTGHSGNLILTSAEFLAGYTPPAYLIDGMIQRGYLYSLTARTGHGKTAVALYMAQCVARGQQMHGCKVLPGTVLVLAGENPDDVRARFFVLGKAYGFEMVLVDTAAAYFPGTETNSNSEQGAYARLLRELTFLKGKPAVIALSHPVKNAARDNLLPMGGSAFLNEVDGNLTLWSGNERQTTLHWQGKFRGPEFDPVTFEMVEAHCDAVKDEAGRLLPSVVAKPMSGAEVMASEEGAEKDEDALLRIVRAMPMASWGILADRLGWKKRKVQTVLERLVRDKLVTKMRNKKYAISERGKVVLGG